MQPYRLERRPGGRALVRVPYREHALLNLNHPMFNKSTAFTRDERVRFGRDGLLPAAVSTIEQQAQRAYGNIKRATAAWAGPSRTPRSPGPWPRRCGSPSTPTWPGGNGARIAGPSGFPLPEAQEIMRLPRLLKVAILALFVLALPKGAELAPPEPAQGPVVRISLEVVQVDAVVTDKEGRYVTDLEAGDFDIFEDGKRQEVALCSYVRTGDVAPPSAGPRPSTNPPPVLRRETVRRTLAFVVDDLSLSFESIVRARLLLTRFVDEQMQPGDLVAILRTGAGLGALQQFTTDRRLLRAAIDRIRFNLAGRGRITPGFSLGPDAPAAVGGGPGGEAMAALADRTAAFGDKMNLERALMLAGGTMGALHFVVNGLAALPGRKSILMFSEGFALFDEDHDSWRVRQAMEVVAAAANRASVTIYGVDPQGLVTLRPDASSPNGRATSVTALLEQRAGLTWLAEDTGGLLLADTNDLARSVERVLDDQKGYYLIGYIPDPTSFEPDHGQPRYHRLSVKVKRRDLRVRSRRGYYGVAKTEAPEAPSTPGGRLLQAVSSPFAATDIALRLTCLFGYEPEKGSNVRALVHIDASSLTFTDDLGGGGHTILEVVAMTFAPNGQVVDQMAQENSVRVDPAMMAEARRRGIVYVLDVPVKRAGAYQFRVAVRDQASGRMGSASQFVEIPDVQKGRLALSGLVMNGEGATTDIGSVDPDTTAAVRRFHRGARASYAFFVYNPRAGKGERPRVDTRVSLLQEGREVMALPGWLIDTKDQSDPVRMATGGTLVLPSLEPGLYTLQVAVTDHGRKGRDALAVQWTDFEVVE